MASFFYPYLQNVVFIINYVFILFYDIQFLSLDFGILHYREKCCDVRYDFRIKTMFGSSFPLVVCMRVHVLFTLFVFVCVWWCPTHIVFLFRFSSSCVTCVASFSGLSILDCPFGIL